MTKTYPKLEAFILELWDGDVDPAKKIAKHDEETLCNTEFLIVDLKLEYLPFSHDPEYDKIRNHEAFTHFSKLFGGNNN